MITLSKVAKNFGYKPVLIDFSMTVYPGEKVGLIGANGSGKTTVFRLIMGLETHDKGSVALARNLKIGHLAQIPPVADGETVGNRLLRGVAHLVELEERMRDLEAQMSGLKSGINPENDPTMREYTQVVADFERLGGYRYHAHIDEVVQGLGLDVPRDTPVSGLSGGERARLEMAVVLLSSPDVLLLDEPTNHLDFPALTWLEGYIKAFRGTVLIISHDRYFLDQTVERIVEITGGKARDFKGNYSVYLEERQRLYEQALKNYENQQKEIKKKEEAIKQLRHWGTISDNEKFFKRAANMEKQLERMEKLERPDDGDPSFQFRFGAERSGREVACFEGVNLAFGGRPILSNLNWKVLFGQRIGLVGPNGSGKTTLLRLLLGELSPESGKVKYGANIKIGYLPQQHEPLPGGDTVLESFREVVPGLPESKARAVLAQYGFPGDLVFRPVNTLSGGERVRFHLLQMVYSEVNLLILDEPTNHLDLPSIEVLEEALDEYQGTLLVVSHDRYFLNRVVGMICALEDTQLVSYPGNYDYYLEKRQELKKRETRPARAEEKAATRRGQPRQNETASRQERTKSLQRELETLEGEVARLECQIKENHQLMTDPAHLSNYQYLRKVDVETRKLEAEVERLLARWEEIAEELAEKTHFTGPR